MVSTNATWCSQPLSARRSINSTPIHCLRLHSYIRAIELAVDFPHVNVTGVDLVPLPIDPEQLPDNFRMEVDDINLGLSHYYGRFDLVHMRLVDHGLTGASPFLIPVFISRLPLFAISSLRVFCFLADSPTFSFMHF